MREHVLPSAMSYCLTESFTMCDLSVETFIAVTFLSFPLRALISQKCFSRD